MENQRVRRTVAASVTTGADLDEFKFAWADLTIMLNEYCFTLLQVEIGQAMQKTRNEQKIMNNIFIVKTSLSPNCE